MKLLKNAAIAGLGVWAGEMVAGIVVPFLPKDSSGGVNPMVEKAVRYTVTGAIVVFALKSLQGKKS